MKRSNYDMHPEPAQFESLRATLEALVADGLLDAEALSRIEGRFSEAEEDEEPWFVRLLIAAGAWFAAICFAAALGIANLLDSVASLAVWGLVCLTAAALLHDVLNRPRFGKQRAATALATSSRHPFLSQLSLALSVLGHALLFVAAGDYTDSLAGPAASAMLLCLVLYPLYRDTLHRFLSSLAAAGILTWWIFDAGVHHLLHVEMLAKIVLIGIALMYRPTYRVLQPLAYAMALSVPATLFLVLVPEPKIFTSWWPANAVLVVALIWLYQWIAGGWTELRREPLLIAAAATVCLGAVTTPGVLAALGLIILGYARWDQRLLAMGIAFFPIFLVVFYYELETSLLVKSGILVASGLVLLVARAYLLHRSWTWESQL